MTGSLWSVLQPSCCIVTVLPSNFPLMVEWSLVCTWSRRVLLRVFLDGGLYPGHNVSTKVLNNGCSTTEKGKLQPNTNSATHWSIFSLVREGVLIKWPHRPVCTRLGAGGVSKSSGTGRFSALTWRELVCEAAGAVSFSLDEHLLRWLFSLSAFELTSAWQFLHLAFWSWDLSNIAQTLSLGLPPLFILNTCSLSLESYSYTDNLYWFPVANMRYSWVRSPNGSPQYHYGKPLQLTFVWTYLS